MSFYAQADTNVIIWIPWRRLSQDSRGYNGQQLQSIDAQADTDVIIWIP